MSMAASMLAMQVKIVLRVSGDANFRCITVRRLELNVVKRKWYSLEHSSSLYMIYALPGSERLINNTIDT